ncbi:PQQ-dependent sugar dehydrogenase [Neorhizobium galegae]|uniref:PQQ-dependent sugar dehydrogenase n=1 Tax=Neorhizobium galegae TaxID=399 RepID=UPI000621B1C2|nr:sorbosone dehydrogenase family protein [Neorhizobium galegae]CDZ58548.1 L-sorbosone dehydrogenase [Neorhizobium galegae bv. orientalis]KAB1121519.1 sorbosone dehydrogenase family protein [Neorhizobium galegae]MCQ1570469.1 sorbosone dehydrogenase family protein [Neorhizobium galegae]MCQ1809295.1 sorbosone dehydrogenase family protein [Neorhizobium galegae]CDZ63777.1 L-sorbosone dehydrogenase [Neorhizobium galegae bv. orientalis]
MMRSLILGTSVMALSLGLGASAQEARFDLSQQIGPNPFLPDPSPSLIPDVKVAEVVGWKDGETPAVPNGLKVTAYAKDLASPRTVHTLSNGDVLVVQSRGPVGEPISRPKDFIRDWIMSIAHGGGGGEQKESNVITLLRDTNRDGMVDERHDLLKKLDSPFGLAWIDNTLYVATTSAILAYPYELGRNEITAQPRTLTPLPGGPINHHWTKDLALSPDGRTLYVSVGSNSNIVESGFEAEKGRAAIWQVDRQTGAARVFASGLRNPNGLAFNPETGALWTVVNERDELGPNLVPDYMTSVEDGAFYGWPWSYYGNHVDARVHPPRPDMVEKAIQPDYALSSHVAALGLTFSMNSALPAAYANGAFIGEHGSWNRDSFNGYKVIFVPFQNGKPSGKAQDVVTGFIQGNQAKGRPVGVGTDGTGALLVADDAGNTVWRVASSDGRVTPQPIGTDQVSVNQQLSSPAKSDRLPAGVSGIGAEIIASTTTPTRPPTSADERLTGQEPLSGQPDKLVPAQMQIAPATGP